MPDVKQGSYSRRRLDLKGQRFGKLTVLEEAENIKGRTAWRCRCDCGREIVAKTGHLRGGHVKTCGCVPLSQRLTMVDGTCVEILQASKVARKNNTSGVPGVEWRANRNRWRASICFQGKRRYLGTFVSFEDAVAARKKAEAELHDKFLDEFAGMDHPG